MRGVFLGQLLFAIATTLSTPALAQTVTVHFTGVVDTVFDQLQRTNITPGMYFRGWYSFDIGAPDGDGDPSIGRYAHNSFGVTVGNIAVKTSNGEVFVANGRPDEFDAYRVRGDGLAFCGPKDQIVIRLVDMTRSAVESDALPPNAPDISRFNAKDFLLEFRCDFRSDIRIAGTITAITDKNSPNEFLWNLASELTRLIQKYPLVDDFASKYEYVLQEQFRRQLEGLFPSPRDFVQICEPAPSEPLEHRICTMEFSLEGLLKLVADALGAVKKNDNAVAINTLERFKNEVALRSGKRLSEDEANSLISQAGAAMGFLGPDYFRFR